MSHPEIKPSLSTHDYCTYRMRRFAALIVQQTILEPVNGRVDLDAALQSRHSWARYPRIVITERVVIKAKSGPTKSQSGRQRAARHNHSQNFLPKGGLGSNKPTRTASARVLFQDGRYPSLAISQMSEPIVCSRPTIVKYFLQVARLPLAHDGCEAT